MAVVTISREFGTESDAVAEEAAEQLGYAYIGKELIGEIAKRLNLSKGEAQIFHQTSQGRLLRLVDRYTCSIVQRVVDREHGCLDDKDYFDTTQKLVENLYDAGNVIILGWGGQCILKGRPETLHVRLVKDIDQKIDYVMDHHHLNRIAAERLIQREEKDLQSYIKKYFNEDWNDARLYNLVIDMGQHAPKAAAAIIAENCHTISG